MKRITALLLAILMLVTLASCGKPADSDKSADSSSSAAEPSSPAKKDDYVLSDEVDQETVVDGVMTDLSGDDPVLKKTVASWLDKCVLYEVNIRQYTEEGTFAAFEEHLDRLKDMGINTLWLMPIHPISETNRKGTLGSYYSVSDYKDVNPEFGTMDDFKHLLNKAHEMGFKVILDWVANHTGWNNSWITEHEDWYKHNKSGEIESPYDWTDTAQLDYDNYEMRAEMIKCMQFWIEDIGVDGFRCDHAMGVPMRFWNAAVYKLKSINSEIMMLAETSGSENLTCYAFDSCYNDVLYGQACMIRGGVGAASIKNGLDQLKFYAEGSFPMNYMDNHDKNSHESSIVSKFENAYPMLLALSYAAPGMPLIYTSDEEGYDHEIEFFEKDPVKWDDDPKYAGLITALSKLKADNEALDATNTDITIIDGDNTNLLAFSRKSGDNTLVYVSSLYFDPLKDVTVDLGFENATCLIHWDGKTLDTNETEMANGDFAHKDYQPYEFYILSVK